MTNARTTKPRVSGQRPGDFLRAHASAVTLTAAEEASLVRRFHAGDARAGQRLVTAHMRFVFSIADSFARYGVPFDELVSEGLLGFMEAVQRFDPERGTRLASYAAHWIRALLRRYTLHNRRIVRPPSTRTARKLIGTLGQARRELAQKLGDEPDSRVLALALGVSASDIDEIDGVMRKRDVPCGGQDTPGAYEVPSPLPSPEALVSEREVAGARSAAVARALRRLDPRERLIVSARSLGDTPRKLDDLGSELGVSRERVRQIQNEAYAKMRFALAAVA